MRTSKSVMLAAEPADGVANAEMCIFGSLKAILSKTRAKKSFTNRITRGISIKLLERFRTEFN